jgi:Asp-tRNA(Asn)/Glu-tRNA(Gln) amidotransferase A subunit family amidase
MVVAGCISAAHHPVAEPRKLIVEGMLDDIQSAIRRGNVSCESIIHAHLERISAFDKATGLNAITVVNGNAIAQARIIDAKITRGEKVGPLFCAAVLIKDNVNTVDMETSGGSIALKGWLPSTDATLVKRLRASDAILVAKTNMAEWAFSARQTVSSSHGTTANAYALDRVPAGSSGGTASGIAASFGVLGIGTDTGNSVRGPASHLSLFGLRPTLGLVSRAGIIPLAFDQDTAGPMTRTVTDGARLLSAVAGYDYLDPYTSSIPYNLDTKYESHLNRYGLVGKRVGVIRELADPNVTNPEILSLFEAAIMVMREEGAHVIDPLVIESLERHLAADNSCPSFSYDLTQYLESQGRQQALDIKVLLSSGMHGNDPFVADSLRHFSGYPADIAPANWAPPCRPLNQHAGRLAFRNDVLESMDALEADVLIFPTWLQAPAALDKGNEEYAGDNSQLISPAAGLPAATVPMGWLTNNLPVGLQLIGRPFADGLLIEISYAYEQVTKHRRAPAKFPALDPTSSQSSR